MIVAIWSVQCWISLSQNEISSYLYFCSISHTGHIIYLFALFFFFLKAAPEAYGSSQARGQNRAAAASLHHSHSHARSKPHLRPTPQFTATPDPWPTERGQGSILVDPSWIHFYCATIGTPMVFYVVLFTVVMWKEDPLQERFRP